MDEYSGLTDKELIARLKKYAIPHGPVVGTTRKLYERKIYEFETERTKHPGRSEAYIEPTSSSHSYTRETFVSPRSKEDFNYGREALGSTKRSLIESYNSARNEEYTDCGDEGKRGVGPWVTFPFQFDKLSVSLSFTPEWDANPSEGSTSSYRYKSSLGSGSHLGRVSARKPIAEPYLYSSGFKEVPPERDSSAYQTVFHRKSAGPSSLGVEPRRAIRPELQAPSAQKDPGGDRGAKRYLPLWPQLLLFVLLAAFLAFTYFFLQADANDNPFGKHARH
uniref:emerin-like n=1 Tax=Euleptes europaea TaxID=460621 RepID=UPI0025411E2F|nr:emerin-like [Euleptes europaea]